MSGRGRLIVVSNRLPVTLQPTEDKISIEPSCGGLVSALVPIVREGGGSWVGWTGAEYSKAVADSVAVWSCGHDYNLEPVFLTLEESASYYRGFSNEIIWPLFHCLPSRCNFSTSYWAGYLAANRKFADAVLRVSVEGDFIWVHDYHLMILGRELRQRGMKQRLAYFHHIPFPPPDIFEVLPWAAEVLQALTHFDLIGFQTQRDLRNFVASMQRGLPAVQVSERGGRVELRHGAQCSTAIFDPISIDYAGFVRQAGEPSVAVAAATIREALGNTAIVLGVDRLDYTKGIPERLVAFQRLLEVHPSWRRRVSAIQVVVPSREEIPEYNDLRLRIERLISNINGQYSSPGWTPIHYFHRCISTHELLAFYRAADVALITPLRDGMNLVAKEFCAARVDCRGVLVLSEFAGAAEELRNGAVIVNPHDTEKVASALAAALSMSQAEQEARMAVMRARIRLHDVFQWYGLFRAENDDSQPEKRQPFSREAGVLG